MKNTYTFIFLISLLFVNCSNNKQNKLVVKFSVNPKLILTISGDINDTEKFFARPLTLDVDDNRNVYILDYKQRAVKKFDKNGNFILKFGSRGSGPGEMLMPNDLLVFNNQVVISDVGMRKMIVYDKNGNFIKNVETVDNLRKLKKLDNSQIISYLFELKRNNENGITLKTDVVIFNNKFEAVKILKKYIQRTASNIINYYDYEIFTPFTVDNKQKVIYITNNSKDNYVFHKFDFDGNKILTIKKAYRKRKFTKEEKNDLVVMSAGKKNGNYGEKKEIIYKKAIEELYFDKNNILWVVTGKTEKYILVDFFKDDKYLTSKKIPNFNKNYILYFLNNRIYVLNKDKCEIKVFDY